MPTYDMLLWPTLEALRGLGGSGRNVEIEEKVVELMKLPDELVDRPHGDTNRTEIAYRIAWARTHLKMIDAIQNSARGVWALTEKSKDFQNEHQTKVAVEDGRKALGSRRISRRQRANDELDDGDIGAANPAQNGASSWQEELLQTLKALDPIGFERLCQRLLRELGFVDVEVTGRSGDGGIDGSGILRLNIISFHVHFLCKRYSEAVGSRDLRDFRGAMIGRADKGIFLTTGRFTAEAKREAARDGTDPIELIDGEALCELLAEQGLGVETVLVPKRSVKQDFFKQFEPPFVGS